jgi:hypothetical protein
MYAYVAYPSSLYSKILELLEEYEHCYNKLFLIIPQCEI